MTKDLFCSSCQVKVTNLSGSVRFSCPSCSQSEIVRCPHCRKIIAKYTCPSCNFTGPN
ncbi:MAG: zinc finger domain-containing protein [Candidatus Nanoarchaeia archaeon]